MKTIKILTLMIMFAGLALFNSKSVAQSTDKEKAENNPTLITPFKANKILTANDIQFLALITNNKNSNPSASANNSAAKNEVMVSKNKFSVGQKITSDEAKIISDQIHSYTVANKLEKVKESPDSKYPCPACYPLYCYHVCGFNIFGIFVCDDYCGY